MGIEIVAELHYGRRDLVEFELVCTRPLFYDAKVMLGDLLTDVPYLRWLRAQTLVSDYCNVLLQLQIQGGHYRFMVWGRSHPLDRERAHHAAVVRMVREDVTCVLERRGFVVQWRYPKNIE
jgi:hypothetical protein